MFHAAIQPRSARAKSIAGLMARAEGAITATSPVEGCTFTMMRRARGLMRTFSGTG
jgi:hypothetical protein